MSKRLIILLATAFLVPVSQSAAWVFCPDDRTTMPMQTSLPWGAVGYINNGCTGVLVDSEHVVAASHCFVLTGNGSWQSGPDGAPLRFYPNYHPDRPNPPWRTIDRAVVGSRTEDEGYPPPHFASVDWGIGHLAQPVTDFAALPILPVPSLPWPVTNAGYGRDPRVFGTGDAAYEPAPVPPETEDKICSGVPCTCGNCWWQPALVDPQCQIFADQAHILRSSCDLVGGNSGSPFIWTALFPGLPVPFPFLAGVVHGGASTDFSQSCQTFAEDLMAIGPAAESFRFAPRRASSVAVAAFVTEISVFDYEWWRTAVFAADADAGRVAMRLRTGLGANDPFTPFDAYGNVPRPRSIAALNPGMGAPEVLVVSGDGALYRRGAGPKWRKLALPRPIGRGATLALDVDSLYTGGSTNRIFLVTRDGRAFTRRLRGRELWQQLPSAAEPYVAVAAAARSDGGTQVFLLTASGGVVTTFEQPRLRPAWGLARGGSWSQPEAFTPAADLPVLADVDAGWTRFDGQIRVVAVDEGGGLWMRTMQSDLPSDGWDDWTPWVTSLEAPAATTRVSPPEGLVTLTAAHWPEVAAERQPVVFATDRRGNIYYTTESHRCSANRSDGCVETWRGWRSFYHY